MVKSNKDQMPAVDGAVRENGVVREGQAHSMTARPTSVFSREAFAEMQEDADLTPSQEEREESYIPLGKPGKAYFTVHPSPQYELSYAFTYDYAKSAAKTDPYLVLRPMWRFFPPSLLRIKRLLLCQSFQDEALRAFLWLADWYETSETPNELHKSIARVVLKARQGWGQALFDNGIYQWRRWPESRNGQMPEPIWPDRDMFDIVQETFQDRIITAPDHALIQAIGEEVR